MTEHDAENPMFIGEHVCQEAGMTDYNVENTLLICEHVYIRKPEGVSMTLKNRMLLVSMYVSGS